jgi:hypothetical protein
MVNLHKSTVSLRRSHGRKLAIRLRLQIAGGIMETYLAILKVVAVTKLPMHRSSQNVFLGNRFKNILKPLLSMQGLFPCEIYQKTLNLQVFTIFFYFGTEDIWCMERPEALTMMDS